MESIVNVQERNFDGATTLAPKNVRENCNASVKTNLATYTL